jgi:adenosylmethionine-8-amino-7-oxononanoate aminotransferase
MGAMALGGNFLYPREDYEPLMPNAFHAPQPNFYRCEFNSESPEECGQRCVDAIESIIQFQGPDTVAAVIAEPISSPMGAVVPPDNYWPLLRQVCDKYGCLLIADEVITGFGRTGKWFGCEHWDVVPDMMTVAKGITSGYIPMGGAILRKPIADAFVGGPKAAFRHVITFGGHPVAAAASLKNLEIMEREGMVENSARMGKYLLDGLAELKQKHSIIGNVRGLGLMCGLEMVKDREAKEHFPADAGLGPRLTQGFADNGLFLRGGDLMNIMPPLCVTPGEVEQIVSTMDSVIGQVASDLGAA